MTLVGGIGSAPALPGAAGRAPFPSTDTTRLASLVETIVRQAERVLDAMRGQQRRDSLQIAAAQNQRDDRLRGHRIESGGRRIVKDQRRLVDQRARDGNAASHAAGKLGGIFVERGFQLDEPQSLAHALVDFLVRHIFLAQAKGDVFRRRSSNRTARPPERQSRGDAGNRAVRLRSSRSMLWPITQIRPGSARSRPAASFMISVFPEPLSPRSTFVSPGEYIEGNAAEDIALARNRCARP